MDLLGDTTMTKIEIIQGDTKELTFDFVNATNVIKEVIFRSGVCHICKSAIKQSNGYWKVFLTSEETSNLPVGLTYYDIDAILNDDRKFTALYRGTIAIKKKDI